MWKYYALLSTFFTAPTTEGSVIRVAPQGVRRLCNTSDEPMVYVCIQSKEKSLEEHTTEDGGRTPVEPQWRKL